MFFQGADTNDQMHGSEIHQWTQLIHFLSCSCANHRWTPLRTVYREKLLQHQYWWQIRVSWSKSKKIRNFWVIHGVRKCIVQSANKRQPVWTNWSDPFRRRVIRREARANISAKRSHSFHATGRPRGGKGAGFELLCVRVSGTLWIVRTSYFQVQSECSHCVPLKNDSVFVTELRNPLSKPLFLSSPWSKNWGEHDLLNTCHRTDYALLHCFMWHARIEATPILVFLHRFFFLNWIYHLHVCQSLSAGFIAWTCNLLTQVFDRVLALMLQLRFPRSKDSGEKKEENYSLRQLLKIH